MIRSLITQAAALATTFRPGASESSVEASPAESFDTLEPRTHMSVTPIFNAPFYIETTASSEVARPEPMDAASLNSGAVSRLTTGIASSVIGLPGVRADARFSTIDGRGTSVVVLDSGINRLHPFFGPDSDGNGTADRIVYQYDFADNDSDASDNSSGHGSNVSSIIGSSDAFYRGVAPGVNIIALKVFTNSGSGNFAMIERALQWVVANVNTYNIVAVNMSLGDSRNYATQQRGLYGIGDELAAIRGMNVALVAASGNSFASFKSAQGVSYPAADPNVIAVGATYAGSGGGISYVSGATATSYATDHITPFTQRSTSIPMVFAPGAPITGAAGSGTGTSTMHGTSQASPHVAGAVALMQQLAQQQLGRRLSMEEVTFHLNRSGRTIVDGDDERDNVTNTGGRFTRIDVNGALNRIMTAAARPGAEITLTHSDANISVGSRVVTPGVEAARTQVVRTFVIVNEGTAPLSLSGLSITGTAFRVERGFVSSTIAPGVSTSFQIRYLAPALGTQTTVVTFNTNDSDESRYSFTLAMTAGKNASKTAVAVTPAASPAGMTIASQPRAFGLVA